MNQQQEECIGKMLDGNEQDSEMLCEKDEQDAIDTACTTQSNEDC